MEVPQSSFIQHILLSAGQAKTIPLPLSVGMTRACSTHLFSVKSAQPASVLASFCTRPGCDHSLLHDVSSWGTHYNSITQKFPDQSAVSQMVITNLYHETSVDVVLSGEVFFRGSLYLRVSILNLNIGVLESVHIHQPLCLRDTLMRQYLLWLVLPAPH